MSIPTQRHRTRVKPFDEQAIAEAAAFILAGECVAIATETVYGLAADATDEIAVARIYEAKGRPSFNPLIVHVADQGAAERLGMLDDNARALAQRHWPGPLTLVVPSRGAALAPSVTAGLATVALRVPAHRAIVALLAATGKPLAAPSANASGSISPTQASHVLRTLDGRIPLIVDDGACAIGVESTIVACDNGAMRLLRAGPLTISGAISNASGMIEAPGQIARHYAPTKPVRLDAVHGRPDEFLIGFGSVIGDRSLVPDGRLDEAASRVFELLHLAEVAPAPRIAIAPIPNEGIGIAINDRFRRCAA